VEGAHGDIPLSRGERLRKYRGLSTGAPVGWEERSESQRFSGLRRLQCWVSFLNPAYPEFLPGLGPSDTG